MFTFSEDFSKALRIRRKRGTAAVSGMSSCLTAVLKVRKVLICHASVGSGHSRAAQAAYLLHKL